MGPAEKFTYTKPPGSGIDPFSLYDAIQLRGFCFRTDVTHLHGGDTCRQLYFRGLNTTDLQN